MKLPVRILSAAPKEPIILVDGTLSGAWGLCLSHWPGNATPDDLRHELSTGAALRFARLPLGERLSRAQGATAIANNHYDTDGICALFSVRHPQAALQHAAALLGAAAAGDFFRIPDFRSLSIDFLVGGLVDPARSPLDLSGLEDRARWQAATDHLMEHLPDIVVGDLTPYRSTFEAEVEAVRADLSDLLSSTGIERAEFEAADLTVWTARDMVSSRSDAGGYLDIGRHARFGQSERDRVLVLSRDDRGTHARLILSTRSWFDIPGLVPGPRPELGDIARRLNELEGTKSAETAAWRAQNTDNATPELWFGKARLDSFAEHNNALLPSALPPNVILDQILTGFLVGI